MISLKHVRVLLVTIDGSNPGGRRAELEMMKSMLRQMQASSSPFHEPEILLPEFHEW